ncbi:MAG: D-tyrosyl-tRNA(Tyr) deacylase [Bacteroidetes bacterium]|uniref:D-aminoacyl-tRNA deacylase n=1 Tax=Candidatus Egerieousia excrementavium TaxID=2840778 RepID=A0A9D9DMU4_9BACT|nr:D-tyrosyl-tRNA(Tyr) deacylase [Candidatus Egerieousia excrementavium]
MRLVIQRVSQARVEIDGKVHGSIGSGLMILAGIEESDGKEDTEWLAKKCANLRIFDDENGVMNRSLLETGGDILLVSQFTLHAMTAKGNRPSYIRAAKPQTAIPVYNEFIAALERWLNKKIATGIFGADMKVTLTNDGPVTIIIDSKIRE